jgi:hypothetical protein
VIRLFPLGIAAEIPARFRATAKKTVLRINKLLMKTNEWTFHL